MKNYIYVLALCLAGCATQVTKPIAVIPPPPVVPEIAYRVDQLTPSSDPGDIAQAYKYDMTYLRGVVRIYKQILDQYKAGSADFSEVNKQIDELVKK